VKSGLRPRHNVFNRERKNILFIFRYIKIYIEFSLFFLLFFWDGHLHHILRQHIWDLSLQNLGDHWTLFKFEYVGFYVTYVALSHPFLDMVTFIFSGKCK